MLVLLLGILWQEEIILNKVIRSPRKILVSKYRLKGICNTGDISHNSRKHSIDPPNSAEFTTNEMGQSNKYIKFRENSKKLNNYTLNISQNYYCSNHSSTAQSIRDKRRSIQYSNDKNCDKNKPEVYSIAEGKYNKKLNTNSKEYINKNKGQKLPDLKMSADKFNMYKYQKSYYRAGQFEKLFGSLKSRVRGNHDHQALM